MGSLDWDVPVNSVKHTPVPDCAAMLNSLWERSKDSLATLDFRGYSGGGQDLHSSAVMKEMSQAGIESQGVIQNKAKTGMLQLLMNGKRGRMNRLFLLLPRPASSYWTL